jgi:hypothetical protein
MTKEIKTLRATSYDFAAGWIALPIPIPADVSLELLTYRPVRSTQAHIVVILSETNNLLLGSIEEILRFAQNGKFTHPAGGSYRNSNGFLRGSVKR